VHGLPVKGSRPARGAQGAARRRAGRGRAGLPQSAGLTSLDQAKIQKDPKKGDFYIAVIEKPGQRRSMCWPNSCR
jgi:glycyl-tRNA synthetase beta chain